MDSINTDANKAILSLICLSKEKNKNIQIEKLSFFPEVHDLKLSSTVSAVRAYLQHILKSFNEQIFKEQKAVKVSAHSVRTSPSKLKMNKERAKL